MRWFTSYWASRWKIIGFNKIYIERSIERSDDKKNQFLRCNGLKVRWLLNFKVGILSGFNMSQFMLNIAVDAVVMRLMLELSTGFVD